MAEPLPQVEFQTNHGRMVFELFEDDVPNTVANFVSLAESGFYNGTQSHRLIKDFMVQLGDPQTKDPSLAARWGTGGPGYCIDCEFEGAGNQSNDVGTLSMAHAGRHTGGSQFFVNASNNAFLNNNHTVFGKLVEGEDVRQKLMGVPTGPNDRPTEPVVIEAINVVSKRGHEYTPKKNGTVR